MHKQQKQFILSWLDENSVGGGGGGLVWHFDIKHVILARSEEC